MESLHDKGVESSTAEETGNKLDALAEQIDRSRLMKVADALRKLLSAIPSEMQLFSYVPQSPEWKAVIGSFVLRNRRYEFHADLEQISLYVDVPSLGQKIPLRAGPYPKQNGSFEPIDGEVLEGAITELRGRIFALELLIEKEEKENSPITMEDIVDVVEDRADDLTGKELEEEMERVFARYEKGGDPTLSSTSEKGKGDAPEKTEAEFQELVTSIVQEVTGMRTSRVFDLEDSYHANVPFSAHGKQWALEFRSIDPRYTDATDPDAKRYSNLSVSLWDAGKNKIVCTMTISFQGLESDSKTVVDKLSPYLRP